MPDFDEFASLAVCDSVRRGSACQERCRRMTGRSSWAVVASALLVTAACTHGGPVEHQPQAATSVAVSVIGTNDLHGGILPRDGRGGLALFSAYVENLRSARARDGG